MRTGWRRARRETSAGVLATEHVILAAGGRSYPATGSDGSGYADGARRGAYRYGAGAVARAVSRRAGDLRAACGFDAEKRRAHALCGGKAIYAEQGEMLFTHTGFRDRWCSRRASICAGREGAARCRST